MILVILCQSYFCIQLFFVGCCLYISIKRLCRVSCFLHLCVFFCTNVTSSRVSLHLFVLLFCLSFGLEFCFVMSWIWKYNEQKACWGGKVFFVFFLTAVTLSRSDINRMKTCLVVWGLCFFVFCFLFFVFLFFNHFFYRFAGSC